MEVSTTDLLDLAARLREGAVSSSLRKLKSINIRIADDIAAIADPDNCRPVDNRVVSVVRERVGAMPRGSVALLIRMLRHPDQVQTCHDMRHSIGRLHYKRQSLKVFAHHLRRGMASGGFEHAVRSDRGAGYYISAAHARDFIDRYALHELI